MSAPLGVGIIGCGNISAAYMRLAPQFEDIKIKACADLNPDAAKARAEEFSIRADSIDALLAASDIDIIVNLTIPAAHFEVSQKVLQAGKHVFSEKPFVLSTTEGQELAKIAAEKNLRIGSAPDTFLGGAHQLARHLIDENNLGKISSGTCHVLSHGMEDWHPNPDFFFKEGGGPMLDLGPYYVTNLIQLLGPIKRVAALTSIPNEERTITSQPRAGEKIKVETPTNIHALLSFASGATITLGTSWDVWSHNHKDMELYGEKGSLFVPDPNFFGGEVSYTRHDKKQELPEWNHPFSVPNDDEHANYRTAGLAEMAQSIRTERPHRCSLDLALHAVDVMTGILTSGETGQFVEMTTSCERPAPFGPAEARALLKGG